MKASLPTNQASRLELTSKHLFYQFIFLQIRNSRGKAKTFVAFKDSNGRDERANPNFHLKNTGNLLKITETPSLVGQEVEAGYCDQLFKEL